MKKATSFISCNAVILCLAALSPADETTPAKTAARLTNASGDMRTGTGAFRFPCISQ